MKNKTAVVLMSGGMDSALCAAIARSRGFNIAALHTNYGQKTELRELESFNRLCSFYEIDKKLVVDINYLKQIGDSSLTDERINIDDANLDSTDIPSSYVPFRNGNLLSIAASWAESIGARAIFIGAIEQDSSGYPDCRLSFIEQMEKAVNLGTKPETNIKIIAPLVDMAKSEIVTEGMKLGLPFELTWSCYKQSGKACGVCDSCALRLRGFRKAGFRDPLEYETRPRY